MAAFCDVNIKPLVFLVETKPCLVKDVAAFSRRAWSSNVFFFQLGPRNKHNNLADKILRIETLRIITQERKREEDKPQLLTGCQKIGPE